MRKTNLNLAAVALAGFSTLLSSVAMAGGNAGSDFVNTKGGISVADPSSAYWFRLGGLLQADAITFHGSSANRALFANGTGLRRTNLNLAGGVGDHWVYELSVDFGNGNTTAVQMRDAYAGYTGLNKSFVAVGQMAIPFGLEGHASSSSALFMEPSLISLALDQGYGLGVYGDTQKFDQVSLMGGVFTPNDAVLQTVGSDPYTAVARGVFAPVNHHHEVFHVGASWLYAAKHRLASTTYAAIPELTARSTPSLSTGAISGSTHHEMYGLEAAGQWDKTVVMSEYQHVKVGRPDVVSLGNLDFDGYSLMAGYMLKGGHRSYDARSATFGAPSEPRGAWETSARYSMARLADANSQGAVVGNGTEHNVTLGLSYWHSESLRVMANYVHVNKPAGVKVDALGLRGQLSF